MEISISSQRQLLNRVLAVALVWIIAIAMGWAITTGNTVVVLGLSGGILVAVAVLRWPSLVFSVIYPLGWLFGSYNIPGIGRPERVIGLVGIAGLLLIALGPERARFPRIPVGILVGLLLLIGGYMVSAWIHPDVPSALDYVISLFTRVAFFYLVYFHMRTSRQLRWTIGLFIASGIVAGLFTLAISLTFGFGFIREYESFSTAQETLGPLGLTMLGSATLVTAPALLVLTLYPTARRRGQKIGIIVLTLFLFYMAFAAEYRREVLITIPLLLSVLALDKSAGLRRPALWVLGISILLFFGVVLPYSLVLQNRLEYETQFVVAGTEPRIASAFAGLQAAANSPLVGYGPGAYSQAAFQILGPGRHGYEYSPYNVFVWILVEAGIFGLLGVVLILLGVYREASRPKSGAEGVEGLLLRSAPALLLLIVIWFTFGNGWELSLPWFLMGLIMAAGRIAQTTEEER